MLVDDFCGRTVVLYSNADHPSPWARSKDFYELLLPRRGHYIRRGAGNLLGACHQTRSIEKFDVTTEVATTVSARTVQMNIPSLS